MSESVTVIVEPGCGTVSLYQLAVVVLVSTPVTGAPAVITVAEVRASGAITSERTLGVADVTKSCPLPRLDD